MVITAKMILFFVSETTVKSTVTETAAPTTVTETVSVTKTETVKPTPTTVFRGKFSLLAIIFLIHDFFKRYFSLFQKR